MKFRENGETVSGSVGTLLLMSVVVTGDNLLPPVLDRRSPEAWSFGFVLPPGYDLGRKQAVVAMTGRSDRLIQVEGCFVCFRKVRIGWFGFFECVVTID